MELYKIMNAVGKAKRRNSLSFPVQALKGVELNCRVAGSRHKVAAPCNVHFSCHGKQWLLNVSMGSRSDFIVNRKETNSGLSKVAVPLLIILLNHKLWLCRASSFQIVCAWGSVLQLGRWAWPSWGQIKSWKAIAETTASPGARLLGSAGDCFTRF